MAGRYPPRYGGRAMGGFRDEGLGHDDRFGGHDMDDWSSNNSADSGVQHFPDCSRTPFCDCRERAIMEGAPNPYHRHETNSPGFRSGSYPRERHSRDRDGRHAFEGGPFDFAESDLEDFSSGMHGGPRGYGHRFDDPGFSSSMPPRHQFPRGSREHGGLDSFGPEFSDEGDTADGMINDIHIPFGPRGGQGYHDSMRHPGGRSHRPTERQRMEYTYRDRVPVPRSEIMELGRFGVPMRTIRELADSNILFRHGGSPDLVLGAMDYEEADDILRDALCALGAHYLVPVGPGVYRTRPCRQ